MHTVKNREVTNVQCYQHNASGLTAFARYIQSMQRCPIWIVLDVSNEAFHHSKLPHVFGHDQRSMLQRKTSKLFHGSRLHKAFHLSREKTGRRDDVFLFAGIPSTDQLDPWIEQLLNAHIPIAGMNSVALLCRHLHKSLNPAFRHVLIISCGKTSGIRQTYLENGKVGGSRLVTADIKSSRHYLLLAAEETEKYWRFLTSSGKLADKDTLHVIMLGGSDLEAMAPDLRSHNPQVKFHIQALRKLGAAKKLNIIRDGVHADDFFVLLQAASKRENPYASHKDRRFYYHLLAGRGMITASMIALLYTLSLLPGDIREGINATNTYQITRAQRQRLMKLHVDPVAAIPASTPASVMAEAVQTHAILEQKHASPIPLFKAAGSILAQFPGLTVKSINWRATATAAPSGNGNSSGQNHPQHGNEYGSTATLVLSGNIAGSTTDTREAIERLNQLQSKMLSLEITSEARIISYPLEIDPEKTLSSRTNNRDAGTANNKFTIRIAGNEI